MTLECLLIPLAGHFLFYRSRDLGVSNDDLGRMLPLLPTPWPWSVFWCPWQDASSFTSLVTLECPAKPVAGCFLFYQSRNLGVSVKPLAGYFLFYQSRDLGVSSDALGRMLPLLPISWPWSVQWCPWQDAASLPFSRTSRDWLHVWISTFTQHFAEWSSFWEFSERTFVVWTRLSPEGVAIKNWPNLWQGGGYCVTHREKFSTCTILIVLPPFIITTSLLHSAPLNRFKHVTCI